MTIKIKYGESNLQEQIFTAPTVNPEPPPYLLEAAYLVGKNKEPALELDGIPEGDDYVFDELVLGDMTDTYLLGSCGAQCLTLLLEPRSIHDLIYILALDRPGPLLSGALAEYLDRKHSGMPVGYQHPKLKPILQNSFGAVLYRNQVLEIAKVIAGYAQGELEELRMTLESCAPGGISNQRSRFIAGAVKNWLDQTTAESIFKRIAYFSRYDFLDEWQAADHALISYRNAYLKVHYPEEYLSALDNCREAKVQPAWEPDDIATELGPLINRFMQARLAVENFPDKVNSLRHRLYTDLFGTE